MLLDGGCRHVVVVLGPAAAAARALLAERPEDGALTVVENRDWAEGMSTSLRAGLAAAAAHRPAAVLVHLVDLPDVSAAVARRVLREAGRGPGCLARAVHGGRPGHPVLIGRDHLAPVLAGLTGDHGAQAYLDQHGAVPVECGDLADGRDVDVPAGGWSGA